MSCEAVAPQPDRPTEGFLRYNVDVSAMASASVEINRCDDLVAVDLAAVDLAAVDFSCCFGCCWFGPLLVWLLMIWLLLLVLV